MTEFLEIRLHALEQAHFARCGGKDNLCYTAVPYMDTGLYRLAFVRRNTSGYWPISEDYFLGTEADMNAEADRLNLVRLDLGPRSAAIIVASSMIGMG